MQKNKQMKSLNNASEIYSYNRKINRMENIKETSKIIFMIVVAIMVIDFLGAVSWAMSGQRPADGFYVGAITVNIVKTLK